MLTEIRSARAENENTGAAMALSSARVGVRCLELSPQRAQPSVISCYKDHRMGRATNGEAGRVIPNRKDSG